LLKSSRRRADADGLASGSVHVAVLTRGGATAGGSEHPRPLGATSRFQISRAGSTVVVSVSGEIGPEDWALVDAVLWDLIDAQGNLDVVLDLCDVTYLERAAVPLIVDAARQAHVHGGHLRLADRACRQV